MPAQEPLPKISIAQVADKAGRRAFNDIAYRLNRADPHWVPPLRSEVRALLDPDENPYFAHAELALFVARRGGRTVGRIAAHVDRLALEQPADRGFGPGTGFWGMMEAEDEAVMAALIARAEKWLAAKGMARVVAPLSLSIWDEPGLLTRGHDHSPTVMMGHHDARYEGWIADAGYAPVKQLHTYELKIDQKLPDIVQRIVASGERKSALVIRQVDKRHFDRDAGIIMDILNDAWSDNWGFVPLTDREIAYAGKKLKPIVYEPLIRIAELDGEPIAFMMTLPDLNDATRDLNGSLFPFGWAKLLWWLRRPKTRTMRVPLMGVRKAHQGGRLASQVAFMMIEYIRRVAVAEFGATRGEIGWVLDDNTGMIGIAETIGATINRTYTLYEKGL